MNIKHIGHISVRGRCEVFGFGADYRGATEYVPYYLNIAGPSTAVEAVWSVIAQRKPVPISLTGADRRREIIPNKDVDKWKRYQTRIPGINIDNILLVPEGMTLGNQYLIFAQDRVKAYAKLYDHLNTFVKCPIFRTWIPRLIEPPAPIKLYQYHEGFEGTPCWLISTDADGWDAHISSLVSKGKLTFPQED